MNDEYEHYEIIRGKRYQYDPDFDVYRRAYTEQDHRDMKKEALVTTVITVLMFGSLLVWGFFTGRLHW